MIGGLVLTFLFLGAGFLLLAAIGLARLPDVYSRMQAATKASTLGVGSMLAATAIHFEGFDISSRVILTIVFIFITIPASAHMIGRAAYLSGSPLWEGTLADELQGKYGSTPSDKGKAGPDTSEASSGSRSPE